MLDEFILSNHDVIIAQARARVATRTRLRPTDVEALNHGIPAFLEQLGSALRLAKRTDDIHHEEIGATAAQHGRDLLSKGLPVDQVVHDYGDVCQVVSDLAIEQEVTISGDEFKTLNLCLDDAIAGAVTAYTEQRETGIREESEGEENERLGELAHELRNTLNTVTLAFESIKSGRVAVGGTTGLLLARGLVGLRNLIDQSLTEVRLDAGIPRSERIGVAALIDDVRIGASLQPQERGVQLAVSRVEPALTIEGDREILVATVSNLLQNALKFTHPNGTVTLSTEATADRISVHVEDECGGLPEGAAEGLFRPFEQRGTDRSGLGLGLSICLKAAKANGGALRVRDIPGKGCVFTLDLPRAPAPPLTVVSGGKSKPPAGRAPGDEGVA